MDGPKRKATKQCETPREKKWGSSQSMTMVNPLSVVVIDPGYDTQACFTYC